jgi:hypothetical protein
VESVEIPKRDFRLFPPPLEIARGDSHIPTGTNTSHDELSRSSNDDPLAPMSANGPGTASFGRGWVTETASFGRGSVTRRGARFYRENTVFHRGFTVKTAVFYVSV